MKTILAAVLILFASTAFADDLRVIDGDGFELNGHTVRIWGIDAPELTQECINRAGQGYSCGQLAKAVLHRILEIEPLTCQVIEQDRYARNVSRCTVAGHDIGGLMVGYGWAVDFTRYSRGAYQAQQQQAESEKRGLWAGRFVMPWNYRRQ